MDPPTIAAIATPMGSGGIGIVRISGPEAMPIALRIFRRKGKDRHAYPSEPRPPAGFQSHMVHLGQIVDPDNNRFLDEVLLLYMESPRSYTREDVVEIQAHSGTVVLHAILELVLRMGARLAEPGEFTRRAFLHGRIDLTQAEAVIDVIQARSMRSLEVAACQLSGELGEKIKTIRDHLIGVLAQINARIDFPEDMADSDDGPVEGRFLEEEVIRILDGMIGSFERGRLLREGLSLLIVGKPNVGKSSLMNRLLQRDRVIVSPVPGTTRDFIEEETHINGIPVILCDTAGLHQSTDPIESVGMKRTEELLRKADLILFMVDASAALDEDDGEIYEKIRNKRLILVQNKIDLAESHSHLPASWSGVAQVRISALLGMGIEELKQRVWKECLSDGETRDTVTVTRLRHRLALEQARDCCVAAVRGIREEIPIELIAADTQEALAALDRILGTCLEDDVLDRIFQGFCIGK